MHEIKPLGVLVTLIALDFSEKDFEVHLVMHLSASTKFTKTLKYFSCSRKPLASYLRIVHIRMERVHIASHCLFNTFFISFARVIKTLKVSSISY